MPQPPSVSFFPLTTYYFPSVDPRSFSPGLLCFSLLAGLPQIYLPQSQGSLSKMLIGLCLSPSEDSSMAPHNSQLGLAPPCFPLPELPNHPTLLPGMFQHLSLSRWCSFSWVTFCPISPFSRLPAAYTSRSTIQFLCLGMRCNRNDTRAPEKSPCQQSKPERHHTSRSSHLLIGDRRDRGTREMTITKKQPAKPS